MTRMQEIRDNYFYRGAAMSWVESAGVDWDTLTPEQQQSNVELAKQSEEIQVEFAPITISGLIYVQALTIAQDDDEFLECDYEGFRRVMELDHDIREAYRRFDEWRKQAVE